MTDSSPAAEESKEHNGSRFRRIEPFALVALGGMLTLLGQCSTAFVETDRARFEASLARRTDAMQFLDLFSATMGARIYAASDYFMALQSDADAATLMQKKDAFLLERKVGILREGIFIARGADYFGQEFKGTLYKDLFVALEDLDAALGSFAVSRSESDAALFREAETNANLLSGVLLGTAARKMEGAEHKPPSLHD